MSPILRLLLVLAFVLLAIGLAPLGLAQDTGDVPEIGLPEPDNAPPAPDRIEPIVTEISKTLRCPVCQGSSINDSPVSSAQSMKNRVRELVTKGYSPNQIRTYFAERYGESMLMEPPAAGLNWVVWLLPATAGGLGVVIVAMVVMVWRKEPDEVPLPSDVGLAEKDPYEALLLEEIGE